MYESHNHYLLVAEYYIGTTTMHRRKPILWVHTQTDINSRHWETFGSRNTTKLNQPYLQITMKSIYEQCKDSFNVCLITDDSFSHLLNWNIDFHDIPCKSTYRTLGLSMLLYEYGGVVVPQSFLCNHDLLPLTKHDFIVAEGFNTSTARRTFSPSTEFMACKRKCKDMQSFISFQEHIYKQKTNQHIFQGKLSAWLKRHATVLDGMKIGIKQTNGAPVTVGDLLGTSHLSMSKNGYGILIPQQDILRHTKYSWFARLSTQQLLSSDLIIAKYMIASH